ncbi:GNAT family N-acetyltransferase [Brevibacillus ginsengisoli]|uniref:GNAT family N-acetyltransferase n=1 Tax=Brevibacillus ginsengisoli TaxID=363854 RepID=UPI003CEE720D
MTSQSTTFTIRHARINDAQEITNLIVLCDINDHGVPDITQEDLLNMWNSIHIETDTWVACSPNHTIIGYAFLERHIESRMDTCVFVHPEYENNGIGSVLLLKVEERANELAEGSTTDQKLMNHIPFTNRAARNLVENRGFTCCRLYKRMQIELTEQPAKPSFPAGITVRSFQPDHDEKTIYELYDQTFCDSWGYSKTDYSQWIHKQKGEQYDASLWFIVRDDQEPAAFMMCRCQEDGLYIELLGVKRAWRKQGIGHSLLLHAFQTAYQRGQNTVFLNVDSESLTNAHSLYERVGMRAVFQSALYQKKL